jgi:hypothetical protein
MRTVAERAGKGRIHCLDVPTKSVEDSI